MGKSKGCQRTSEVTWSGRLTVPSGMTSVLNVQYVCIVVAFIGLLDSVL